MSLRIEYGVDIIVGVVFDSGWRWYVSEKELWLLDQEKLRRDFEQKAYVVPAGYADRFHLAVVSEQNAPVFLTAMKPFRVETETLRRLILDAGPTEDEKAHLAPSLLVDFDARRLYSLYPEPVSFEDYVPHGWIGSYEDFRPLIPAGQRYWIIDGRDCLYGP